MMPPRKNRQLPVLGRLWRMMAWRVPALSPWGVTRKLILRANAERDAQRYPTAAVLYEEALRLLPNEPRLLMQSGHMFKEAGDYDSAERQYVAAARLLPDDPDVAIQLGHFYKVAGRRDEAAAAYRRATELRVGWDEAARELASVQGHDPDAAGSAAVRIVPELLPRAPAQSGAMRIGFHVRRLGATRAWSRGGYRRVLRGVEAIRGFIVSEAALTELVVLLDGAPLYRTILRPVEPASGGQGKFVFNIWIDFISVAAGEHRVELRAEASGSLQHRHNVLIDVAPPLAGSDAARSDAVVAGEDCAPDQLVDRINARPSVVRPARRMLLGAPPRAILVQRADQLGDLVCSVPALQRLRALFPAARIVLLATAGNADLARTLDMVDEVVAIDFPEDAGGHKALPAVAQEQLRARLAPYAFDLAIDLAETAASRPLLLLSGARFLYGFKAREFPWLSAGFELGARDPGNEAEMAATAHKLVAMVDALGDIVAREPCVVRRRALDRAALTSLGLPEDARYAVLHTGARLAYTRWPGFAELARLLIERTDLIVVVMGDAPTAGLPDSPRIFALQERLSFDQFDALLSFASLFVGNDSGPKHLASLRGTPVVSLHMARLNWSEWGQEASGLIVSRRVPCAGCGIGREAEECGQDFACLRHIRPEEVFAAAQSLL